MPIHTQIFLLVIAYLSFACSVDTARDFSGVDTTGKANDRELEQLEKLEEIVEKDLVTTNANGEVTDLQGFEPSPNLDDNEKASEQELREMYQNDEEVFEFIPPEGVEAEFSAPSMITGSSLFLANNSSVDCQDLGYQNEEPGYKEILDDAYSKNICGSIKLDFCIRMIPSESSEGLKTKDSYVYTKTPSFSLDIPCESDSFNDLLISIADGLTSTENSAEAVKINAISSVTEIYLSNTSGCSSGGQWEVIANDSRQWQLEFIDNLATVYAKFRDRFGAESECISDSIQYGPSEDACFAGDANYKAENILSGVSIGGLEGNANLGYPVCTSDGETGCIVMGNFEAENSDSLAAKVMIGETVGGIAGSVQKETRANCSAGGQENCITTDTYKSMDLSSKDAGGALDIDAPSFSARIKSASLFEFWDETGTRYTASGDADIAEANILDSIDIFGITGTAGAPPDCSSIPFGTWILVPGNTDYGTNDFCVMKYEAKCSETNGANCTASASTENPTSTAANSPWTDINQQDAITECASLGKGYHLMTNDEWMTIATNVAAVGSNWQGGVVGTNAMAKGHSDNDPGNSCEASSNDANAYVETNCTGSSSGTFDQRRTHSLSNGEVIWDLAGNVWELTSYFNDEEKPTPNSATWYEYTLPVVGTTTMPLTDLIPQVAIDSGWDSNQNIGQYYPEDDATFGVLIRGGYGNALAGTGVFAAGLDGSPTMTGPAVGFRCTISVIP